MPVPSPFFVGSIHHPLPAMQPARGLGCDGLSAVKHQDRPLVGRACSPFSGEPESRIRAVLASGKLPRA